MSDTQDFHANGKLLLTAEYFVLDGALALAIPTRFGQQLRVRTKPASQPQIHWRSKGVDGKEWFSAVFSLPDLAIESSSDQQIAERLKQLFQAIGQQRTDFWQVPLSQEVETQLDFPHNWGLGTSSTLVATLAKWARIDPFLLLENTFGGSGYDIACANAPGPILYQRLAKPQFVNFPYSPPFSDQLFFVFLGKKQNSRDGIQRYRQLTGKARETQIAEVNLLTTKILQAQNLEAFESITEKHENLISAALQLSKAKQLHFPDYWGVIKSLGAWGGDFILATSNRSKAETKAYFQQKGFTVILEWAEMIGMQK